MLTLLVVAVALSGALADMHESGHSGWDPNTMRWKEFSFEWQELESDVMTISPIKDWMNRGFHFRIATTNDTSENMRWVSFLGAEPHYEYLGVMGWTKDMGFIVTAGDEENLWGNFDNSTSCGRVMWNNDWAWVVGNLSDHGMAGEWVIAFDDDMMKKVWWKNEERGFNDWYVVGEVGTAENLHDCAPWMWEAHAVSMGMFSDGTDGGEMDWFKYAKYTQTSDECERGEFYWMNKCQKCPPGKSTVRKGNNEYSDCIEHRYISCRINEHDYNDYDNGYNGDNNGYNNGYNNGDDSMNGDDNDWEMECERNMCPCNDNYEECDWDHDSEWYGMCKESEYRGSAMSVAGATTLVTVTAAFFTL